jgi:hypothetical protein
VETGLFMIDLMEVVERYRFVAAALIRAAPGDR